MPSLTLSVGDILLVREESGINSNIGELPIDYELYVKSINPIVLSRWENDSDDLIS